MFICLLEGEIQREASEAPPKPIVARYKARQGLPFLYCVWTRRIMGVVEDLLTNLTLASFTHGFCIHFVFIKLTRIPRGSYSIITSPWPDLVWQVTHFKLPN